MANTLELIEKIADTIPDYGKNEEEYNKYFTQLLDLDLKRSENIGETKREIRNIIKYYVDQIRQQLPKDKDLAFIIGRTTAFMEDDIIKALEDI